MANIFDDVEKEFGKLLPKTTIEMESGFENIPEGSRVRTTLTDDPEQAVEGYAYPSLGQVALGHTPLSAKPPAPIPPKTQEVVGGGTSGMIRGILGIPGMANRAANELLRPVTQPLGLYNPETAVDRVTNSLYRPSTATGRFSEAAGEQIGGAMPFMGGTAVNLARKGQPIMNALSPMLQSATGAGIGAGTVRAIAPDSPKSELAASILGGFAPNPRTLAGALTGTLSERLENKMPRTARFLAEKTKNTDAQLGKMYVTAIRPSVSGKGSYSDIIKNKDNAVGAIKQIVNISRELQRPVPTNLDEFSEMIEVARQRVFSKYNDLSKQTGEKGAMIPVNRLADDLEDMAANKLAKYGKGAVGHARELANQLRTDVAFTPEEAERLIAIWNNQLKAYYTNKSGSLTETTAGITDAAARYLRATLDDAIERFTGPGYQQLKNQYGQLRSIEKDVINRTMVDARKAPAGLLDFSDMFSASKAVYAASKLDPAGAAAAGTLLGVKKHLKAINDPNRLVKNMFRQAEKIVPEQPVFAGPAERELGWTTNARQPDGVTQPRDITPKGPVRDTSPPIIEGEYRDVTPLPGNPRAGLLESPRMPNVQQAPWNPVNTPGAVANRMSNIPEPPKTLIDVQAMAKKLYEMGYPPGEIQQMIKEAYERGAGK